MMIVVTGASGFLGRRLVERLRAEGESLLGVDLQPAAVAGVPHVVSDLSDATPVLAALGSDQRIALVHLAWDLRRASATYEQQSRMVTTLARLLESLSPQLDYVVGLGSAEEYGLRDGVIRESDPPVGALSPYGSAKRSAHDLAESWSARTGKSVTWIRPFVIYGPGQGGDMAVPYAVRQAKARALAEFTDGLQERDFIYVDDMVELIVRALRARPAGFQVVNAGRGEPVPLRDVLQFIASSCGASDHFVFGARPRRPGEPARQVADLSRLKEIFHWTPETAWRAGLEKTCE